MHGLKVYNKQVSLIKATISANKDVFRQIPLKVKISVFCGKKTILDILILIDPIRYDISMCSFI